MQTFDLNTELQNHAVGWEIEATQAEREVASLTKERDTRLAELERSFQPVDLPQGSAALRREATLADRDSAQTAMANVRAHYDPLIRAASDRATTTRLRASHGRVGVLFVSRSEASNGTIARDHAALLARCTDANRVLYGA